MSFRFAHGILALSRRYRREEVDRALKRALADGTATAAYVRKILECEQPGGLQAALWAEFVSAGPKLTHLPGRI